MLPSSVKVCFNSSCKSTVEKWKRGWRLRTGDYANLCDPCGYAYEEGKFCEAFHLHGSGWRSCETCGKQIHCGCIVSFHMFVLLDAGGVECLSCAKRSYIVTPNPAWPHPSLVLASQSERINNFSLRTSSAVPRHKAPSWSNGSDIHYEVKSQMPTEVNISGGLDRFCISKSLSSSTPALKKDSTYGEMVKGKLNLCSSEVRWRRNAGIDIEEQRNPFVKDFKPMFGKNDDSSSNMNLDSAFRKIEKDVTRLSDILSQRAVSANPSGKQVCDHIEFGSSGEDLVRDEKARRDGCGRNQITNKELHQISHDFKSVTTPLFEKILSASDTGKVGRLVLPKKCAEAYFPPIAHPEGVPLKLADVKGKEWVLQFRSWTNNKSRMYVLEGITPCIQSMNLLAGDVVTFSRLGPEGKLMIGGRKTSATKSLSQLDDVTGVRNGALRFSNCGGRKKAREVTSNEGQIKDKIIEDELPSKSKRNNGYFGSKSKRLRIDNDNAIELKITWKEAQALMRPLVKTNPSIIIVEGCEFEEFEDSAPLIGRPTITRMDQLGFQWVQCEDCFKWRKVPSDAILPLRWICSENTWDHDRSLCSAAEELSKEQLELLLFSENRGLCSHNTGLKRLSQCRKIEDIKARSTDINNGNSNRLNIEMGSGKDPSALPLEIDLNIQPMREEDHLITEVV